MGVNEKNKTKEENIISHETILSSEVKRLKRMKKTDENDIKIARVYGAMKVLEEGDHDAKKSED